MRFYISEYNGQGHLANDERVFTKKYRLQRSFESLIKLSKYVCQVQWTGFSLIEWFFVSIKKIKNAFFASVFFWIFNLNVI